MRHTNIERVNQIFIHYIDNDAEINIATNDGEIICVKRRLLCFHSKLVSEMIIESGQEKSSRISIFIDCSSFALIALLALLTSGVLYGLYGNKRLSEKAVVETAAALGIKIENISIIPEESEPFEYSLLLQEDNHVEGDLDDTLSELDSPFETEDEMKRSLEKLQEHIETLSEKEIKADKQSNMNCEFCAKSFKSLVKLRIHTLFHSNFRCTICGHGFRMSSLLERHRKSCNTDSIVENLEKTQKILPYVSNPVLV